MTRSIRNLVIVLGDQLDARSAAFDGFDPARDAVAMGEVREETDYIPQHKARIVLFLAAMRHFRDELRGKGLDVRYTALDDRANRGSHRAEFARLARQAKPERLIVCEPGDWRVLENLRALADDLSLPLEVVPDRHFLCSTDDFAAFAEGRRGFVMETFYRWNRGRLGLLMDGGDPVGGRWNFDTENRKSFGRDGPGRIKAPRRFTPDETTAEVVRLVERLFPDAPGRSDLFDLPVTRAQALAALRDFVEHRLEGFGRYQDAMATGHPYLYHARLSTALNLHLIHPREVVEAAIAAYDAGGAPIESVEGFVRQIVGWREFVRGVYWREMPDYADRNALSADLPMPRFMWTAETEMNCVRQSVGQLADHAYAHHIQRLMVLGLHALLLGVRPLDVHRWHISMYADAVDWVSLPNTLGMSQHADGGLVGTKPYCASGAYISRMSDYCRGCRFDPRKAEGEDACPFTTLYWDFLARHRGRFLHNQRMKMQIRNLDRRDGGEIAAICRRADALKSDFTKESYP